MSLFANALFVRYCRSRLRKQALVGWIIMTLIFTAFVFFTSHWAGMDQLDLSRAASARLPVIPLLIMQSFILFFLGTGAVASGMTAEEDEGVMDYQRLVPMSPISKVMGYLLGLPVREWILFLVTLPFSFWCFWKGQIRLEVFGELYAVVVSTALLYHMTALLAATVMKSRRLAFLGSMGLIFALYTVMPSASKLGLVAFNYLTITPTVEQFLPVLTELPGSEPADGGKALFFGLVMSHSRFTLISQGAFFLIVGTMLWRRWRRSDCHLLGKIGAMISFGWLQAVLLGTSLPLIASGRIFPMNGLSIFTVGAARLPTRTMKPAAAEGEVMVGFYGLLMLVLLWIWTVIITPSPRVQRQGWRRAAKLDQSRLAFGSDAAGAGMAVFVMAMMGAGAWCFFTRELFQSLWFKQTSLGSFSPLAMVVVACTGGLLVQQLIERKGRKTAFVFWGALALLPLMAVIMTGVLKVELGSTEGWLVAFSPIAWTFLTAKISLVGEGAYSHSPGPFWLVQGLMVFWWFCLFRKPRATGIEKRNIPQDE
ncbi:MAG: hypothetical protein ACI8UZ_003051 [Akkermansiaceae bacterium]|jgi:hypothetical protein